jgi:hypothetical protein
MLFRKENAHSISVDSNEPFAWRTTYGAIESTFYEQVTGVNLVLRFSFIGLLFLLLLLVSPHAALHRVSIRTLDELS